MKEKNIPLKNDEDDLIFLENNFPNLFIHNKSVVNSINKRFRPDYQSLNLKLIIEFDGYSHYCN